MVELINSDPAALYALVTCDESWIYCYDLENQETEFPRKHAGSPRPEKARQSKSNHNLLIITFLTAMCSHLTDSQQGILFWGFEGVQEGIPREEASTLQIGSVAFPREQCTSPQLHPDYLTKMGIKTVPQPPYSPDLAPCDLVIP